MSSATAAHRSAVRRVLSMARIGWSNVGESVALLSRETDLSHLPRVVRRLLRAGGITRITNYAGAVRARPVKGGPVKGRARP